MFVVGGRELCTEASQLPNAKPLRWCEAYDEHSQQWLELPPLNKPRFHPFACS